MKISIFFETHKWKNYSSDIRISQEIRQKKTKLNRISEFWKQDVESNTSFPPFKWFPSLCFFFNLDSWWNYQEFNMCVVLTRDFEVKKQQKVLTFKWLNFTYMNSSWSYFQNVFDYIDFFLGLKNPVWDDVEIKLLHSLWNFVYFVWNLLLFWMSQRFWHFWQIFTVSNFSDKFKTWKFTWI